MNDKVISVQNLTKIYPLYERPVDRLKESLHPFRRRYHNDFHALQGVSFSVKKGETLGIIGRNGSGKSTLLKVLTGILTPTSGEVFTSGRISALLELGAGFNVEYTGLENIYVNGTIKGYRKEEMDAKLDDIIAFADIGEFLYQPVKTYSSGMFVRLAFAVAINVDPEILFVDEALSVGDIRFQQKCLRKIEEFREDKTVIFVSHDLGVINRFCTRAIWLNEGKVIEDGEPFEVAKKYQAFMIDSRLTKYDLQNDPESKVETELIQNQQVQALSKDLDFQDENLDVLGDNKAIIVGAGMFDSYTNARLSLVVPGQSVKLILRVKYNNDLEQPIIGFSLKDRLNTIILQTNSFILEKNLKMVAAGQITDYCFEFEIPYLNSGIYTISPAIASGTQDNHVQHSWVHDALVIEVIDRKKYRLQGLLFLPKTKFYVMN